MASSNLRIGFVGAGENTRKRHLPGFQAISGVELTVVCNRTSTSSQKVAHDFGIGRIASDWREIVSAPDVDAVCIGTWPYLHAEITIAALRAGKHVLSEARMARNVVEAEDMLAESRRYPQRVAQIVPAPMSLAFDALVQGLIKNGELGELREVCVTHTGGQFCSASAPLSWRQDTTLSGVNQLTLGIYYEMLLRWWDEDARVVAADAGIFTAERIDPEGAGLRRVTVPDSVSVLGRYASGARLIFHCSGVEGGVPRNEIRLNGSKASLRIDFSAQVLTLAAVGGRSRDLDVPAIAGGGWRVEADFVESVRHGAPVRLTDFATGVRYMRFTEDVWSAWRASADASR